MSVVFVLATKYISKFQLISAQLINSRHRIERDLRIIAIGYGYMHNDLSNINHKL